MNLGNDPDEVLAFIDVISNKTKQSKAKTKQKQTYKEGSSVGGRVPVSSTRLPWEQAGLANDALRPLTALKVLAH